MPLQHLRDVAKAARKLQRNNNNATTKQSTTKKQQEQQQQEPTQQRDYSYNNYNNNRHNNETTTQQQQQQQQTQQRNNNNNNNNNEHNNDTVGATTGVDAHNGLPSGPPPGSIPQMDGVNDVAHNNDTTTKQQQQPHLSETTETPQQPTTKKALRQQPPKQRNDATTTINHDETIAGECMQVNCCTMCVCNHNDNATTTTGQQQQRLHPKNLISKAYVNHTKANKVEGLVVVSEGPKLIHREEKLVLIFRHPPKDQQTEEFDCWTIHHFAHVTEEGEESGLFAIPNSGGGNTGGPLGVSQPNPNSKPTTKYTTKTTTQATDGAQGNNNVPLEIIDMLESNLAGVDSENATLICNMVPGMVDDDNQPLPEDVPLPADKAPNSPQFFSNWEQGGTMHVSVLTQR